MSSHLSPTSDEEKITDMILVMGVTGAGKSYLINKLANHQAVKESASLESCEIRLSSNFLQVLHTNGTEVL